MGSSEFTPVLMTVKFKGTGNTIDEDLVHSIAQLKAFMSHYKGKFNNKEVEFYRNEQEISPSKPDFIDRIRLIDKALIIKN